VVAAVRDNAAGVEASVVLCADTVDAGGAVEAVCAWVASLALPPCAVEAEAGTSTARALDFRVSSGPPFAEDSFDGDDVPVASCDFDASASLSDSSSDSDSDDVAGGLDDGELDGSDAEPDGEFVAEVAESDELEVDESDDDELESSASATAGHPATAAPTPSATASPPTRPMYFA
jgi:hypothetical protein